MITSMHIKNFKCFKDFDIELGPFNVLIGPNDSGKTSLLQAIELLSEMGMKPRLRPVEEVRQRVGFPLGQEAVWRTDPAGWSAIGAVARDAQSGDTRALSARSGRPKGSGWIGYWAQEEPITEGKLTLSPDTDEQPIGKSSNSLRQWFPGKIGKALYVRFTPEGLRAPAPLSTEKLKLGADGTGLPRYLHEIWGGQRDAFLALESEFYQRFPEYKRLVIEPQQPANRGEAGLGLSFETTHKEVLSAKSVSDGAILGLAYLTLCYDPSPPAILLIEEPETGIHHARLKEIVQTLKGVAGDKGVQVILTTHSPYLLDEVEMDQVHVFQKDDEGAVHARKLSEFKGASEISDMFATGEKWSLLSEQCGI